MIEGGGSRNYVHAKKMMYNSPADWDALMGKLVAVTAAYSAEQVRAGADVIQIFDSWVGCLSVEDYRRYVLPARHWHGEARCRKPARPSFISAPTAPRSFPP